MALFNYEAPRSLWACAVVALTVLARLPVGGGLLPDSQETALATEPGRITHITSNATASVPRCY
jgi:hypothetical protein